MKTWRRKPRKGKTHTHAHPDGAKSRENSGFIYLFSQIPRCLEVSPPPRLKRNQRPVPGLRLRQSKGPRVTQILNQSVFFKCAHDLKGGAALTPNGLANGGGGSGWDVMQLSEEKTFKSLMVGDVLKAASANYYRRCTSGLQHRFHLSSWQLPALPLNLILVSSAISSPWKAHNFNPSGAPLAAFTATCGSAFWSPPPPGWKNIWFNIGLWWMQRFGKSGSHGKSSYFSLPFRIYSKYSRLTLKTKYFVEMVGGWFPDYFCTFTMKTWEDTVDFFFFPMVFASLLKWASSS